MLKLGIMVIKDLKELSCICCCGLIRVVALDTVFAEAESNTCWRFQKEEIAKFRPPA
jgi:hypothetical protein